MPINSAMLKTLWPRAPQATRDAIIRAISETFRKFDLTTDLRVAHFMAQISHECGGGTIVRENMNYSAERLMQIFGVGRHSAKVTEIEARRLAKQPKEIAERVYGLGNSKKARELGNTRPGDGWRFRGNGMLQLTGGGNHKRIGDLIGVNLYDNPEQLENPIISFQVAAAEFKALNCISAADSDNVGLVTRRVNGGSNGLGDRQVWLRKWKSALAANVPATAQPEIAEAKIEEQIEADALPRAAEKPSIIETIKDSKIAKGAVIAETGLAGDVLTQVSDAATKAKDIKGAAQETGVLDVATHLLSSPRFWIAVVVIVVVAGMLYWRWRDHARVA